MTDKEVMQLALDNLIDVRDEDGIDCVEAILKLRAALAQPEPKPVAWMLTELDGTPLIDCGDLVVKQRPVLVSDKTDCIPLYTAPSQREWVGLTDDERKEIALEVPMDAVCITEAKLKKKNT